jgi:hypothetical protein
MKLFPRPAMFFSKRTHSVCAGLALAALLGGCGGSSHVFSNRNIGSTGPTAPSEGGTPESSGTSGSPGPLSDVASAMAAQPRIVQTFTRSNVQRIVLDHPAGYLAFYTSGKVTRMDKGGVEYVLNAHCYSRFRATPVNTTIFWLGWLHEVTEAHYTTRASGSSIVYTSRFGHMTVDKRTKVIRSAVNTAVSAPHPSTAFTYPASVAQLPTPAPLCHQKSSSSG